MGWHYDIYEWCETKTINVYYAYVSIHIHLYIAVNKNTFYSDDCRLAVNWCKNECENGIYNGGDDDNIIKW